MSAYLACIEHSQKVRRCIRAGMSDTGRIARIVGITEKQLLEHYSLELELTNEEDVQNVADVAYEMAVSGRFPHMTQWYLSRRGGIAWQENRKIEIDSVSPLVVVLRGNDTLEPNVIEYDPDVPEALEVLE